MPLIHRILLRGFLLAASVTTAVQAHAFTEEVRVRLFDRAAPRALTVSAEHGLLFLPETGSNTVLAELPPYQKATVRREGDGLHVSFGGAAFRARALRVIPRNNTLFKVAVLNGGTARKPRRYPGRLHLRPAPTDASTLLLINHVLLDEYVACVIAREYGFKDLEGSKAMAVLARTYVLRSGAKSGNGYDLVDHQMAQQYDGADRLTDTAIEATIQTLGEVLTYNGELIEAVYFSSSGGHTADNDAVWNGKPLPYLRGVPDPYDAVSPHAQWRIAISRKRLLNILTKQYGSPVEGLYVDRRSRSGRVQTIELVLPGQETRTLSGNAFRLLLNKHLSKTGLKSTLFDIQRQEGQYVFEGRGFGHGVGLSQYGALGMSKQGYGYRDILAYYFTGTAVRRLGDE